MSSSEETETDDGTHGLARKRVQVDRAGSRVPSCLSMKSDRSMDRPVYFSGEFKGDQRVQVDRAGSHVPSCLSMKSDHSMDRPVYFSGEFKGDQRVQVDRAGSRVPSCLSMKSDRSMDRPVYFSGEFKGDQRVQVDRAGSRVPSCLSMKSDRSMDRPVYFSGEFKGDQRVQVDRAGSRVPSCLSMKSDRSMDRPVYFSGEFKGDQRIHCSLDLSRSDEMNSEKLFFTKQGSLVQRGGVPVPDGDVPQQDSLNGCRVEGFQDLLGDSEFPQLSEVIQVLPCLSHHSVGVQCPCQVLCDVDTEVLEISHPLYRWPIDL
ncbi:uncharacterized protein LOC118218935 [Anguilla anguilla]|uniref:uncharacterized protein LOC118218935 n=1 Tax=Anguilla anguilla TaxID=7936 RepID=UPI0015AAC156|nr:uncharacterized protein LOC118218935 [Anguilla anguilla]